MSNVAKEIARRRTFAIISHPDAGKTTITEKLLLYGGAIQMAGSVKAKRSKKFATSDWMELEKQRGISVTSSVLQFPYKDHAINLIDTPGHEDFSEDTYRTLTAVDSALMLIDAGNGVEAQTVKLFKVCSQQKVPIITFINKMDRFGKEPFDLIDEVEKVLGLQCFPMTWPIGQGPDFRGVYDRLGGRLLLFDANADRHRPVPLQKLDLKDPDTLGILHREIGEEATTRLIDEIDLLEGAGDAFDREKYLRGELAPVFFGSAINNFGIETLLDALIEFAPAPRQRESIERMIDANEKTFTGFIFKIQANMDPRHRDRVGMLRIVSGHFTRGMKAHHVRLDRDLRLGRPTQFMAQDRSLVDEAFAGDIVGIHDPGLFKIGDSFSEGEKLNFKGIPVFAPEHFCRVQLVEPLKSKQLNKGLDQLSEEGAIQVFRPVQSNDLWLGVVGVLQFDVVKYRVQNEYNVDVRFESLSFGGARWLGGPEATVDKFCADNAERICLDQHGNRAVVFDDLWRLGFWTERNPGLEFFTTSQ